MADMRISKNYNMGERGREVVLEVTGMAAADLDGEKLRRLVNTTFPEDVMAVNIRAPRFTRTEIDAAVNFELEKLGPTANVMRTVREEAITPGGLMAVKKMGCLDAFLDLRTEIDIPTVDGEAITIVCAHVTPTSARFVFKDCWDKAAMNDENTNKGGYFKSKGRKHVLEDILPRIAQEWRDIITPRKLVEIIDGERVEYSDPLWLPSATDVFGPPNGQWWNEEGDSFQLPIFVRERDRVKECGDEGTCPQFLRSVGVASTYGFCGVGTGGGASAYGAYYSLGFAPGFDI